MIKKLLHEKKILGKVRSSSLLHPHGNSMSTQIDDTPYTTNAFECDLPHIYRSTLHRLRKIFRNHLLLHLFFLTSMGIEVAILAMNLTNLGMAAIFLGALFFTFFTYLISFFYQQTKKEELFVDLKEDFLEHCRKRWNANLSSEENNFQEYSLLAEASSKLASYLEEKELSLFSLPFLNQILSRFYSKDLFTLQKLFLEASLQESLKEIRIHPTDLELHASLAHRYTALAKLYEKLFLNKKKEEASFLYEKMQKLAVQELKILSSYAPDDPWIYEELEKSYQSLKMHEEELKALEMLSKLRPQDPEILYRLGLLYFRLGIASKGLETYQILKQWNFKKAEELITHYGTVFEEQNSW